MDCRLVPQFSLWAVEERTVFSSLFSSKISCDVLEGRKRATFFSQRGDSTANCSVFSGWQSALFLLLSARISSRFLAQAHTSETVLPSFASVRPSKLERNEAVWTAACNLSSATICPELNGTWSSWRAVKCLKVANIALDRARGLD